MPLAGIFLCLSHSAMLSGLHLACFSVSRLQLEMEAFRNQENVVKVIRLRKGSWENEKGIISHFDLLKRLFGGVMKQMPSPIRKEPVRRVARWRLSVCR